MTGSEVIEEIKRLPQEEQVKVFEYTNYAQKGQLSPKELGNVLREMVESDDPSEKAKLKEKFVSGFYGNEPHA